jgi:hypothetical protein
MYWISKEHVSETKENLWHVWESGITHSKCIDAFKDKSCAEDYCKFLNENATNKSLLQKKIK